MDVVSKRNVVIKDSIRVGGDASFNAKNFEQNADMYIGGTLTINTIEDMEQNANITTVGDMDVKVGKSMTMKDGTVTTVTDGMFFNEVGGERVLQNMNVLGAINISMRKELEEDEWEDELDNHFDLDDNNIFKSSENETTLFNQLNFLYDSGVPLFDLYSTQDYENAVVINQNVEYWIENIAI